MFDTLFTESPAPQETKPVQGLAGAQRPRWLDHAMFHPAGAHEALLTEILDQFDRGILLLAPDRRLLHFNRVAQRECAVHPALRFDKDYLVGRRPTDTDLLTRALHDAARGLRRLLNFGGELGTLPLVVMPLHTPATGNSPNQPGRFLALLAKRSGSETLNIDLFSQTNDLTAKECEVLKGLSQGLDPGFLAQHLGMTLATLRTHIVHIRQKTGAPHLRALMGLVHNLPPVVCSTELQR